MNFTSIRDRDRAIISSLILDVDALRHACVDIDGVLCKDPTSAENDDGKNYEKFLANAEPLLRFSTPIGTLVTNRLERYRLPTETWLAKNRIQYENLVMCACRTQAERRKAGNYGKFKASVYVKEKRSPIFIESCPVQAREIARLSGKLVYCVDAGELLFASGSNTFIRSAVNNLSTRMALTRSGRVVISLLPGRLKRILKGESSANPATTA